MFAACCTSLYHSSYVLAIHNDQHYIDDVNPISYAASFPQPDNNAYINVLPHHHLSHHLLSTMFTHHLVYWSIFSAFAFSSLNSSVFSWTSFNVLSSFFCSSSSIVRRLVLISAVLFCIHCCSVWSCCHGHSPIFLHRPLSHQNLHVCSRFHFLGSSVAMCVGSTSSSPLVGLLCVRNWDSLCSSDRRRFVLYHGCCSRWDDWAKSATCTCVWAQGNIKQRNLCGLSCELLSLFHMLLWIAQICLLHSALAYIIVHM